MSSPRRTQECCSTNGAEGCRPVAAAPYLFCLACTVYIATGLIPRVQWELNLINKLALSRAEYRKIYYGWWLVGAAVVCQFTFLSVGQVVVGVLLGPVVDEMG